MASGSAAGSTPAPGSDSKQSDPAPEPGAALDGPGPDLAATAEADAVSGADTVSGAEPKPGPESKAAAKALKVPAAGLTGGIGCAALLLPLVAVAGAVLCFAAGILSTATGCSPNGSALCSSNGAWYSFALPVFISPLVAAAAAVGAVTVRRHRSTWLAVGYGIVFISIIIGLATASTGSH